jgi:Xaa-Pro aminopeptidase
MWRMSGAEMKRRWELVRARLVEKNFDALIVQGYEDKIGGNVKWLTDVPAGYPRTVIFHANDLMSVVEHGPKDRRRSLDGSDADNPGIGEVVTNWAFHNAHYNSRMNADDTLTILNSRGYRRIAIVGPGGMPHGFVAALKDGLEGKAELIDDTDHFDRIKAHKSAEELDLIRAVARSQDEVFALLLSHIKPGMRDFEINAFIDYQLQLRGAERGTYIGHSAPIGTACPFSYRHFQARTMQRGDHICVLLESNGYGGYWTEIARTICFGKAAQELRDTFEICREAQSYAASLCVPGASAAAIATSHDEFMVKHGSTPESRLFAHAQGHDMVERPLIRQDETLEIPAACTIAIHPTHATKSVFAHICDNYIVEANGKGQFIHATEKTIFEL